MTTFGKILTVFVFLFSLAVGALCVVLYSSGLRYWAVTKKLESNYALAEASEKSLKEQLDKQTKENAQMAVELKRMANANPNDSLPAQVKKLQTEFETRDQEVKTQKARIKELEDFLLIEKKKNSEFDAIVKAHQLESKQNLEDKLELKKQLQAQIKANADLQVAANNAREDKVKFEIKADALEATNKDLVARMTDLAVELTRAKKALATGNTGSTGATPLSLSAPNPPTFAVDGKVLASGDGLVEISVGGDAGLVKGHTLDAYRLNPRPQYLGMIRLVTVEPTRSVGQLVGKPVSPLQRGDNVASKLAGN